MRNQLFQKIRSIFSDWVIFVLAACATFSVIGAWAYYLSLSDCRVYSQMTGKKTQLVRTTCYIEVAPGKWEHWREHFHRGT